MNIQNEIIINHGNDNNKDDELPEQLMITFLEVTFINPNDIVLEIGGNIGRNSYVIGKILNDRKNLMVIESDPLSISK